MAFLFSSASAIHLMPSMAEKGRRPSHVNGPIVLSYTITVRNDGPSAATGVELTHNLPDSTATIVSVTTSRGTFTTTGGVLDAQIGTLAPGQTAAVTVEIGPTDPAYALLELSSVRTGGIGVRFMPDAAGMRVLEVVPDSPADRAGLGPGDLVVDVSGQPTAGMESEAFVELMTGEEGTDVTFTVGWSGDTGLVEETVTVARRFLDG